MLDGASSVPYRQHAGLEAGRTRSLVKCVLHIGSNKTGTSSLQYSLDQSRDQLRSDGVLYPLAGTKATRETRKSNTRQVGFRFAVRPLRSTPNGLESSFGLDGWRERWRYRREFRKAFDAECREIPEDGAVILSDEALFIFSDDATATGARRFLKRRFETIEIVVYLRRPDGFMAGAYSQAVKQGSTLSTDEFMRGRLHEALYHQRLAPWIDAFGADRIRARAYGSAWLRGGDVVADFANAVGIRLGDGQANRVNQSLDPTGLALLLCINRICAERSIERPRGIRGKVSREYAGKTPGLTAEQRMFLVSHLEADHASLVRELFAGREDEIYSLQSMLDAPEGEARSVVDQGKIERLAESMIAGAV